MILQNKTKWNIEKKNRYHVEKEAEAKQTKKKIIIIIPTHKKRMHLTKKRKKKKNSKLCIFSAR